MSAPGARSAGTRRRQAAALIAGALASWLAIGPGPLPFYWTPLALGLTYLAAAAAGGRRAGFWATALVLVGWGSAVLALAELGLAVDPAGAYLVGAGLGALVGAALARHGGVAVDPLGAAATVVLAGLLLALEPEAPALLGRIDTYALLVGIAGVIGLALAERAPDG